jgi:hypothetical protein
MLMHFYSGCRLGEVRGVGVEPPRRGHCPLHPLSFTDLKTATTSVVKMRGNLGN